MLARSRWRFLVLLALAVVAVGAGWLSWLLRTEDLGDALVAEAVVTIAP